MAPRGLTNPAPKTDSARSALSAFTCTLCNKSYSRHPEYEAHISSYDHQHRKRLQDLKQLSRDPQAAEKARRAERKADAEAGLLRVLDTGAGTSPSITTGGSGNAGGGNSAAGLKSGTTTTIGTGTGTGGEGSGGFKKGGFKSSFTTVKGPSGAAAAAPTAAPTRRNVLGDDDEDDEGNDTRTDRGQQASMMDGKRRGDSSRTPGTDKHDSLTGADGESDTDEGYASDLAGGGYYNPRRPTGCSEACPGRRANT